MFDVDLSELGKNSIMNYIFHYTIVLALATVGFYDEYSPGRVCAAVAIASVQAQFWMNSSVASVLKYAISPSWFHQNFLLQEGESNDFKEIAKAKAESDAKSAPKDEEAAAAAHEPQKDAATSEVANEGDALLKV